MWYSFNTVIWIGRNKHVSVKCIQLFQMNRITMMMFYYFLVLRSIHSGSPTLITIVHGAGHVFPKRNFHVVDGFLINLPSRRDVISGIVSRAARRFFEKKNKNHVFQQVICNDIRLCRTEPFLRAVVPAGIVSPPTGHHVLQRPRRRRAVEIIKKKKKK